MAKGPKILQSVLTRRVMLMTVLTGLVVWLVISILQENTLRTALIEDVSARLVRQAGIDRIIFNQYIQKVNQSAKLIVSQKRFVDYVTAADWASESATRPRIFHNRPPAWMPRASVLRAFATSQFALLFDANDRLRDIYDNRPHQEDESWLPETIIHPGNLLRNLSHNQAFMTEIEQRAFILSSQELIIDGRLTARILLASELDNAFLNQVKLSSGTSNILTLIDPITQTIYASSDSNLVQTGQPLTSLEDEYLIQRKSDINEGSTSFFDYGGSNLKYHFASLTPLANSEQLTEEILQRFYIHQGILSIALIIAILLISISLSQRISKLTSSVMKFSSDNLGMYLHTPSPHSGDELEQLSTLFGNFSTAILESYGKIQREMDHRLEMTQQLNIAMQKQGELELLEAITEILGVGIILNKNGQAAAHNGIMQAFVARCGNIQGFTKNMDVPILVLENRDGGSSVFYRQQHTLLDGPGILVQDITERMTAIEARKAAESTLKAILDHTPAVVYMKDVDSCYIHINKQYENLLHVSNEGIAGETDFDLFPYEQAEQLRKNDLAVLTTGQPATFEETLRQDDGDHTYLSEKFCIRDADENIVGIAGISTDITERKQIEEELERHRENLEEIVEERTRDLHKAQANLLKNERLATLGRLTATVSHELRNPLAALRTSIYLLHKISPANDKAENVMQRIDRNITRCDKIVNELLDYTRTKAIHYESVTLDTWVAQQLNDMDIDTTISINQHYGLEDLQVSIGPDLLRRALNNVIDNACQAMLEAETAAKVLDIRTQSTDQRLEIIISDTGPGMDEHTLEHAFEPLFSTKGFGVGLGMTIVKQIMQAHEGDIEIESGSDAGTRITLWLPRPGSPRAH